jgi:FtsP/CotA-like multicopper oxidase with cupredoxin domain
MGWADRGIARKLQPRLPPVGSDFHFGNGWAPEIWGKGGIHPYAFSSDGKEGIGNRSSDAVGRVRIGVPAPIEVLRVCGYQEVDFVAGNPGLTLFHCHQQLHMDFGFMCLFDYV